MLTQPKDRKVAAVLAFAGAIPIPILNGTISGLHKFYLGQDGDEFEQNFNARAVSPAALSPIAPRSSARPSAANVTPIQVGTIAEALRQLDQLRQDGLVSEYEFEQKRRQLLDRIK
jgi:Short C-terminal domain